MLLWFAPAASADPALTGFYGGGYGAPPNFIYTQLDLTAKGDQLSGDMYQPYTRTGKTPFRGTVQKDAHLHISAGDITFDLGRTAIGLSGTAIPGKGRPQRVSFVIRPGGVKPEILATYEGTYDLGHGRLLSLSRNNEGSGFWYLELPSERTGFLFNVSNTRFLAGACFYCVDPVELQIDAAAAKPGGKIAGVDVREHGRTVYAPRVSTEREEPASFVSADGTQLAGTIFLPAKPGPYPAVVLAHGSGAQSRNGFYGTIRFLAEAYARAGIAALAYDKRGVGDSKGDWEKTGFELLAQDATAAVRALRARSDIDPHKIGLSGSSQAGWILPLATRHVSGIALMQIRSGSSPMGVEESERLRVVRQMRGEHFAQADIDRALRIRSQMDEYAKTGRDWHQLQAAFKPVENTLWAQQILGGLPDKDAADWPWLREAFTYDTRPDFQRYRGPLQVLYGEEDFVAVAETRAILERALGVHRTDADVQIAVWPGANHDYFEAHSPGESEFPDLSHYVRGFHACVTGWAAQQFGIPGASARICPKSDDQ